MVCPSLGSNVMYFDEFQHDNSIIEVEMRMSLQKLLVPYNVSQDVFFTLESRCSKADKWSQLDKLVVELEHNSEVHTKHFFLVPQEFRSCPFLHMIVATNSTVSDFVLPRLIPLLALTLVCPDIQRPIAMQLRFVLLQEVVRTEVVLGILILASVYVIIIFDLLHRTVAALLGSFLALGTCLPL